MDAATVVFKLIIKFLLADNNRPGGGNGRRLGGGRAEFCRPEPAPVAPGTSRGATFLGSVTGRRSYAPTGIANA